MSTASTGHATGVGERVGPAEARAVRGVDDQVRGGQTVGRVGRVDDRDTDAPRTEARRRRPTVGAVVALAGHDDDPASVRAVEQPQRGAGDGGPGPFDQHLGGLGRGAIDLAHLLGCHDRDHDPESRVIVSSHIANVAEIARFVPSAA